MNPKDKVAEIATRLYNAGYASGHHDTVEGQYTHIYHQDVGTYHRDMIADIDLLEELHNLYMQMPTGRVESCDSCMRPIDNKSVCNNCNQIMPIIVDCEECGGSGEDKFNPILTEEKHIGHPVCPSCTNGCGS